MILMSTNFSTFTELSSTQTFQKGRQKFSSLEIMDPGEIACFFFVLLSGMYKLVSFHGE